MSGCLLCLQTNFRFSEFISINSPEWFHLKILEKVEKHFWSIDDVKNILGICILCWSKLNEFHAFYRSIVYHRNMQVLKESNSTNCLEMVILPLNAPQIFQTELVDDIKIEEAVVGDEPNYCVSTGIESEEIVLNAISTEKRKRGRPKKCNINKTLIKKPKGKRGRPRKCILDENTTPFRNDSSDTYSKIVNQDVIPSKADLIHQPNYTHEEETSQKSVLGKALRRGRPPGKVKRSRGRPRKIQMNKEIETRLMEETTNDETKNADAVEKLLHKKNNFFSRRKKRTQHKTLMRNYIATSVRCMKFLKND